VGNNTWLYRFNEIALLCCHEKTNLANGNGQQPMTKLAHFHGGLAITAIALTVPELAA
jgi:hypothetical protein